MTSDEDLIGQLLDYYAALSRDERPDLAFDGDTPWTSMDTIAEKVDPERAWRLTLELLSQAPESFLGYIAAGPLETLVDFHGDAFIDRLEKCAHENAALLVALDYIIVAPWVSEDVGRRLRALCPGIRFYR